MELRRLLPRLLREERLRGTVLRLHGTHTTAGAYARADAADISADAGADVSYVGAFHQHLANSRTIPCAGAGTVSVAIARAATRAVAAAVFAADFGAERDPHVGAESSAFTGADVSA